MRGNALITLKSGLVYALPVPDAVAFALVASAPAHSTTLGVLIADKLEIKGVDEEGTGSRFGGTLRTWVEKRNA